MKQCLFMCNKYSQKIIVNVWLSRKHQRNKIIEMDVALRALQLLTVPRKVFRAFKVHDNIFGVSSQISLSLIPKSLSLPYKNHKGKHHQKRRKNSFGHYPNHLDPPCSPDSGKIIIYLNVKNYVFSKYQRIK